MRLSLGTIQRLQLVGQLLIVKLTVVLVIFLAYKLLPFNVEALSQHFVDPRRAESALERAFTTWDGQHYLFLSESGYAPGQQSDIQFPLYPAVIHAVTPLLGGDSVVAALVVSNLASLAAFVLLFDLVAEHFDDGTARRTLLLLVAFPTAFFFDLIYSEAVFLLLAVLFFRFLMHGQLARAAIPAFLLPLARSPGILIVLPFAAWYLQHERPLITRRVLWLAAPGAGVALYLGLMWLMTGDALAMAHQAQTNGAGFSLGALLHPWNIVAQLVSGPIAVHGYTDSALDRAFFLAFVALLVPIFRRVPLPLAIYALCMGTISVLGGSFDAYMRYLVVVFPLLIVVAQLLQGKRAWLWTPLLFLFTMLQGLFVVMQASFYWVA
ncbi:MAG TPA: mannosyltransferase family protein [Chloroflexota bacterium]|nr:mannosyltransferase family protein [Chloroflexota bacterium]